MTASAVLVPVQSLASVDADLWSDDIVCLATNIYFESRNQSYAGQMAVGLVTLNRVEDPRYPNTICGVVYDTKYNQWWMKQGKKVPQKHKCQFSWYCDGLSDRIRDVEAYQKSVSMAQAAVIMHQSGLDFTDGATHYHTVNVEPVWRTELTYLFTLDEHHFYRREM